MKYSHEHYVWSSIWTGPGDLRWQSCLGTDSLGRYCARRRPLGWSWTRNYRRIPAKVPDHLFELMD